MANVLGRWGRRAPLRLGLGCQLRLDTLGAVGSYGGLLCEREGMVRFALWIDTLGEGNGNPLQYSCLENPVDGGAWWAAVHGVAQSRTQLKQLGMHACIGEGNVNPLQYSCLESPRDRGAWWAAVYGVAQSWT